jgi:hypothetical protein
MELKLDFCAGSNEPLLDGPECSLILNVWGHLEYRGPELERRVKGTIKAAQARAERAGQLLTASLDLWSLNNSILTRMPEFDIDYTAIDATRATIAIYRREIRKRKVVPMSLPRKNRKQQYDVHIHPSLVRYGNVELRVIQNFLLDPARQRAELDSLTGLMDREEAMYAPSRAASYLDGDDFDWNLRRLMTNAGFYASTASGTAGKALEKWAEAYVSALGDSHLVWHNDFSPYYLKIQRALWLRSGKMPTYVAAPNVFTIYDNIRGRAVLFLSPLAHLVRAQVDSGRLWNLYLDYKIPEFSLRALDAWISTWPNRPHSDWTETFEQLCESVDYAHAKKPFEVFIASCGCYGLPICDYVRRRYGCSVLYIGNFAHVLFGIRQRATRDYLSGRVNSEMWMDSDLRRFPNVERIDGGRYV